MANENAGEIYVEIRAALDKLQGDINKSAAMFKKIENNVPNDNIKGKFDKMGKDVGKSLTNMSNNAVNQFAKMATGINAAFMALPIIGLITMAVGAIKSLFGGISDFINETAKAYQDHQKELAKMEAVINSTGAVVWTSTRELEEHAKALAKVTTKTTDEIMAMQSVLLGYKTITGETFDRVTAAIVDMTAVMGGDLVGTANTVGKALDNPILGMTALSRQGFIFTKQEKELVKALVESGKHFEAQEVILKQVEEAFKGVAKAQAEVTEGQSRLEYETQRLKVAQGEITSQSANDWANWRANWKAAQADAVEAYNKLQWAYRYDPTEDNKRLENKKRRSQEEFETERERIQAIADYEKDVLETRIKQLTVAYEKAAYDAKQVMRGFDLSSLGLNILDFLSEGLVGGNWDAALLAGRQQTENIERAQRFAADYARSIEEANNALTDHVTKYSEIFAAQELLDKDNEKIEHQLDLLKDIEKVREETLAEIARINEAEGTGMINAQEAQRRRTAAYEIEVNAINNLITATQRLTFESSQSANAQVEMMNTLNAALATATRQYKELYNEVQSGQRRVTAADHRAFLEETMRTRYNALRSLSNDLTRGAIEIEDFNKEVVKINQNAVNAIEAFHRQSGIRWTENLGTLNAMSYRGFDDTFEALGSVQQLFTQLGIQLDDIAAREQAIAEGKWNDKIENEITVANARRIGDLETIRDIEKEIAIARLRESETFKNATLETQQEMLAATEELRRANAGADLFEMLNDYRSKTLELNETSIQGIRRQRQEALQLASVYSDMGDEYDELIRQVNEYYDLLERREAFKAFAENTMQMISQALSAIGDLINAVMRKYVDKQLEIIQESYNYEMSLMEERNQRRLELLEEDYQNQLYYASLARATTDEHFEADLQKAMATGDHRLIYKAEQAKKEFEIRREYERKVKEEEKKQQKEKEEAEKEYQNRKVELEYKAAMAQWVIQLALTGASVAQAIMVSFAQLGPIAGAVAAGIMGAIGAVQIGAVIASKPERQRFADGGIVSGNPFRGDAVPILAKGREMMLTDQDQTELLEMIRGGRSNQPIYINTVIELDGEVVAEKVFEIGTLGNAFINARGVIA